MIGRGGNSGSESARDSDMTLLKFRTEGKVKTEEYLRTNKVLKQHLSHLGQQYQQVRAVILDQACRLDIFMKTQGEKKLKLKNLKPKTQEFSP